MYDIYKKVLQYIILFYIINNVSNKRKGLKMNEYEIKNRMRIFEDYLKDLISLDEYAEKMSEFEIKVDY